MFKLLAYNKDIVDSASQELESLRDYLKLLFIQNRHLIKQDKERLKKKSTTAATTTNDSIATNEIFTLAPIDYDETNADSGKNNFDMSTDANNYKRFAHCLAVRFFLNADLAKLNFYQLYNKCSPAINKELIHLESSQIARKYGKLIKLDDDEIKQSIFEWTKLRANLNERTIDNFNNDAGERIKANTNEQIVTETSSLISRIFKSSSNKRSLDNENDDEELNYEFDSQRDKEKFQFYMIAKWSRDNSNLSMSSYLHYGIPRASTSNDLMDSNYMDDEEQPVAAVDLSQNCNECSSIDHVDNNNSASINDKQKQPSSPCTSSSSLTNNGAKTCYYMYSKPSPMPPATGVRKVSNSTSLLKSVLTRKSLPNNASSFDTSTNSSQLQVSALNLTTASCINSSKTAAASTSIASSSSSSASTAAATAATSTSTSMSSSSVNRSLNLYKRIKLHMHHNKQIEELHMQKMQQSLLSINNRSDLNIVQGGIVTNNNIYYPVSVKKRKYYE